MPAGPPGIRPPALAAPAAVRPVGARRPRNSTVLGSLLILVGAVFLLGHLFSIDLGRYGWPLFIIVPGVLILLLATGGRGAISEGLTIVGSIVTVTGLLLLYQSTLHRFASWAYAWPLVIPGGVGVGMVIYGLRAKRRGNVRAGLRLIAFALVVFLLGAIVFEGLLNIGGLWSGVSTGTAVSVLVIVAGAVLLLRGSRSRAHRDAR